MECHSVPHYFLCYEYKWRHFHGCHVLLWIWQPLSLEKNQLGDYAALFFFLRGMGGWMGLQSPLDLE